MYILGIATGLLLAALIHFVVASRLKKDVARDLLTIDVMGVVVHHSAGIHKRIDENRELIEHLQMHVPGYLVEFPWVADWLRSQDEFLVAMANAAKMPIPAKGQGLSNVRPIALPNLTSEVACKALMDKQRSICGACADRVMSK